MGASDKNANKEKLKNWIQLILHSSIMQYVANTKFDKIKYGFCFCFSNVLQIMLKVINV